MPVFYSVILFWTNIRCQPCVDTKSIRHVNRCPLTEHEWVVKSKEKNCSLNPADICLDSQTNPLVYHCVVNADGVGFVEICSQVFRSLSYCVEFSKGEMRLVNNFSRKCDRMSPSCPSHYPSSEIFKFTQCLNSGEKPPVKPDKENNSDALIATIIVLAVLFTASLIVLLWLIKKRWWDVPGMINRNRHSSEIEVQDGSFLENTNAFEMHSLQDVQ